MDSIEGWDVKTIPHNSQARTHLKEKKTSVGVTSETYHKSTDLMFLTSENAPQVQPQVVVDLLSTSLLCT